MKPGGSSKYIDEEETFQEDICQMMMWPRWPLGVSQGHVTGTANALDESRIATGDLVLQTLARACWITA